MSQSPLIHHPDGAGTGIWKRFWLTGRTGINSAPWLDAVATSQFVGTCKACGGCLKPSKPYRSGLKDWYPARCITCHTETAAAGPRPKAKPAPKGRP